MSMHRRRFLGIVVTGGLGLLHRQTRGLAASREALPYCSWRFTGEVMCREGILRERWEYLCCEGSSCDIWWDEWRVVGSC